MQASLQRDHADAPRESFGQLIGQLTEHSAALVRDEMALAKQELKESTRSLSRGLVTVAIGSFLGLIALGTLAAAAVIGLAHYVSAGYAALIVGGALAVLALSVALVGINRLKRTSLSPEQTIETLKEDRQWLKELT
jgi:uncharacterized membrane protein YqjE